MPDTKRRRVNKGSIADRVLQILDADGGWFTTAALHLEYELRFSQVNLESLHSAIYRILDAGFAERRFADHIDYGDSFGASNFVRPQLHIRANTRAAT